MTFKADDYLVHHGIRGQKWGIRRFQYEDGSLTEAGKIRYSKGDGTNRKNDAMQQDRNNANLYDDIKKYGIKDNPSNIKKTELYKQIHSDIKNERKELNQSIEKALDRYNKMLDDISDDVDRLGLGSSGQTAYITREQYDKMNSIVNKHTKKFLNDPVHEQISKAGTAYNKAFERETNSYLGKHAKDKMRSTFGKDTAIRPSDLLRDLDTDMELNAYLYTMNDLVNSTKSLRHEDTGQQYFKADDYLEHHGIKGMRWGVRRYQNYDGTYTQKGVQRYKEKDAEYEKVVAKAKATKRAWKEGRATKQDYKYAKGDIVRARNAVKLAYKQLKKDKMADQGKKMYKEGQRIRSNNRLTRYIGTASAGAAYGAYVLRQNGTISTKDAAVIAGAAAGANVVNGIISARNAYVNRRISAYYSH